MASGQLIAGQADIFALPVREASFDIVVCYGVLQHTGDPRRALGCLWRHVAPGGCWSIDTRSASEP